MTSRRTESCLKTENGNKRAEDGRKDYVTPSVKKFPPIKVSTGQTYYYYTYYYTYNYVS